MESLKHKAQAPTQEVLEEENTLQRPQKVVKGGIEMYKKKLNNSEQVANYFLAAEIGFGVPVTVKGDPQKDLTIYTDALVSIEHAILYRHLTKENAVKMIKSIENSLLEHGLAHCDIKLANFVYDRKSKKIFTIDNGDLQRISHIRKRIRTVSTPGYNDTDSNYVEVDTDSFGFESTYADIRSL